MQLNQEEYRRVFKKYLDGKANTEEIHFVETYYNAFNTEDNYTDSLSVKEKLQLEERIKQRVSHSLADNRPKRSLFNPVLLKYKGVAAILLGLAIGAYILAHLSVHKHIPQKALSAVNKSVDQPTLKLANGKVIRLGAETTDKAIHERGGVTIACNSHDELVYSSDGDGTEDTDLFNELTIPKGKQFKLVLADGTKVWLNTASTLRYPVTFAHDERKVLLNGEAFFDVAHDKDKPFLVQSKASEIRVAGTQFNVSAYTDEAMVKTTLVEGSVAVSYNDRIIQLTPGEQAISNLTNEPIKKIKADLDLATAWKDGFFVFDQPLDEVTRMMARWYDLHISIDQDLPNKNVAGRFSQKRDFRQILAYLGQLNGFSYTINGDNVAIKKINDN